MFRMYHSIGYSGVCSVPDFGTSGGPQEDWGLAI